MDEVEKKIPEREPKDSGVEEVQQPAPNVLSQDLTLVKSREGLEGHPLPETLRDLAPAFRSHPAWMLIVQWTSQITKESETNRNENTRLRGELEGEKIRSATLQERLSGFGRIASLKTFIQAIGTLIVGLTPTVYDKFDTFSGSVALAVGIIMILAGWLLGKSGNGNAPYTVRA